MTLAQHRQLTEAGTLKANAQRIMRDIASLLGDKALPEALRGHIETVRSELKRTWADLADEAAGPMAEGWYGDSPYSYVPSGAKSFADLAAVQSAQEAAGEVNELVYDYQCLTGNIMADPATDSGGKIGALQALSDEFITLIGAALTPGAVAEGAQPLAELAAPADGEQIVTLAEAEQSNTGPRSPLKLDVRLITPGWGNSRDKNYYSPELLQREAAKFVGAKMYTSDHRESEKSVRTEVAHIDAVDRFDQNGAPIARVTVFDPDFAEATRNRAAAGLLGSLECSILALGSSKTGTAPDGKTGNIVEAITRVQSVDWVTRAGAGGAAVNLAESETGVPHMLTKAEIEKALAESKLPEPARKRLGALAFADAPALQTAITAEAAYLAEVATPAPEPQFLAEAAVTATLGKSTLPEPARRRLAAGQYADGAALDTTITAEVDYLKSVTGSGRPLTPQGAAAPAVRTLAEADKTADHILDTRFGARPARKEK